MHKSQANQLTSDILAYLFTQGCFAWRQNTQGTYDAKKGIYRPAAKVGVPDILSVGPLNGVLRGIEVKIGRDTLSDVQEGFKASLEAVGGYYIIAKDFDSFKNDFEKTL